MAGLRRKQVGITLIVNDSILCIACCNKVDAMLVYANVKPCLIEK